MRTKLTGYRDCSELTTEIGDYDTHSGYRTWHATPSHHPIPQVKPRVKLIRNPMCGWSHEVLT